MGFFTETRCAELENGFGIYHFYRPGPMVELQFFVATGSIHENKYLGYGLSHFLEHMLFQGCRDFPGHSVSDTVTALGGDLNAYSGFDRTCYRIQLPAEHWRQGVHMLSMMLRYPELPEKRFVSEREVILRECERGMDNVNRRMFERFMRLMFLQHPLRHPIIGYKELIAQVTREDALAYHAERYTPGRSFCVVVGDCEFDELFAEVAKYISDWQSSNIAELVLPSELPMVSGRSSEIEFDDPVSRLIAGVRAPEFGSPELPAVEVLSGILGGGDASVLNRELVLDSGIALNADSFCSAVGRECITGVMLETSPGKFGKMQKSLAAVLQKIRKGAITSGMLQREKQQQYADRLRTLRDVVNIAGEIGGSVLYTGSPAAGDAYLESLKKVDMDQLLHAAETCLDWDKMAVVTQHTGKKNKSIVKKSAVDAVSCQACAGGAGLVHIQDKRLPMVSFSMVLPGGGIYEKSGKYGVSRLLANMFATGTDKMSGNAILQKLDECGADFAVSAGTNTIIADFSVPKEKLFKTCALVGDILGSPRFGEWELEREKFRIVEQLKVRAADPVKSAMDRGACAIYGDHPCAGGGRGKIRDVENLSVADLEEFYSKLFYAPKTCFGFAGDCSENDARKAADLIMQRITWAKEPHSRVSAPVTATPNRQEFSLAREQTVALCCLPGPAMLHRDSLLPFEILLQSENSLGSHLFKEVREKHALCYSVGMTFFAGFYPGMITFYTMTQQGAGEKVLGLLKEEILRIGSGKLGEAEFESARKGAIFECAKIADSPEALLRNMIMDHYYGFDPMEALTARQRIQDYTRAEFEKVVSGVFDPAKAVEVLVTPEKV